MQFSELLSSALRPPSWFSIRGACFRSEYKVTVYTAHLEDLTEEQNQVKNGDDARLAVSYQQNNCFRLLGNSSSFTC